ncbi:lysylphosphatidylglycerol synthase transmembrane domain-containing protein [Timonella senegalensis]|uniref:lysylphosphatidylglycerol synthase transmembrane domain-containing protein n=1 Tax=Timonella senegalensis TaxID=1465825 RepID=UPI0028B0D2C5|nr:lysylphosphatidylglycerol synthase transmembrane domain-containing protein [Timonella senegalensis]
MPYSDPPTTSSHNVGDYYRYGDDSRTMIDLPAVTLIDDEKVRVRQPRDLFGMVLALLGVAALMVIAVFARGTAEGVQEDVKSATSFLSTILSVPVVVLESLVTLLIPAAVLTELALRRLGRQVLEAAAALALGLIFALLFTYGVSAWGSTTLIHGLSVLLPTGWIITVPGYVAGLCGLLTAAGPRQRRRTVSASWSALWISLAIVLIFGQVNIIGVFCAVMLGRVAGLTVRYLSGVASERAQGEELIAAVRKAGFDPISLMRIHEYADYGQDISELAVPEDAPLPTFSNDAETRVYAMQRLDGPRLDVFVLDGDRQIIGFLQRLWRSLRVRGIEGRSAISLRAVAERAALLSYASTAAGVRTHKLLGVSQAADSMLLVFEHPERTVPISSMTEDQVTDDIMREAWRQLDIAHKAGLAHRNLAAEVLLVSSPSSIDPNFVHPEAPKVWLSGWQSGDIAAATLSKHMDNAQMLSLLALKVGPDRAIASAREVLREEDLMAVGPLLQSVVLPRTTRTQLRARKNLINEIRSALVQEIPETDIEPRALIRFGAKTILTWAVTIIAVFIVFTTIKLDEITAAVSEANSMWAIVALVLGLLTWFGAALTLIGFSPVKLPIIRTTLVQAAASFVALAAPAGIGPAALNLRMLTKRGVATSLAVATVALVQVSAFVVTVAILAVLSVFTGQGGGALSALPSTTVIVAIISIVAVGGIVFTIPSLRKWLLVKIEPTVRQVWPRLTELLSNPWRLTVGILGHVILTLGYIFAFDASLAAFGFNLTLLDAAIVYLIGNTLGALAPTPGGMGAIEVALITGLTTTAGVPAAIATSAVILFRFATYWIQIPLGWMAMRYLQRKGEL